MNNIANIGGGEPVRMSALLGQVAISVQVKTSCLGLTRTDKRASEESTSQHSALQGVGRVVVSRMAGADGDIKTIKDIQTEAGDLCKSLSTPWNGRRLMPNVNFQPFLREYKLIEEKYEHAIDVLIDKAPALIEKARYNLGEYNIQPPTLQEIRQAFSMEIIAEPIPDTSRYNASNLDRAMEEQLREQFEKGTEAAFAYAQKDVLGRVAEPLQRMVERLNAYNDRETSKDKGEEVKGGYFRDTLVTNVQDIAHIFGSFNLFNDPDMAKLEEELKVFFTVNAKDLRDEQVLRDRMISKANDILSKIDGYL